MTISTVSAIQIPKGDQCCKLSIINTTCDITVPPNYLVEPDVPGWDWINLPTFSFYIKHERTGRQLLFDLGARKDWENHVPHIKALIENHVPGIRITKDVLDILPEGNVNANDVEALILSHFHFDHSGAPSKLASSTKAVVGPGFQKAFLPGWPARGDSSFYEDDFGSREVFEVPFNDDFKIGHFQAYDYFGDGSFYILHTPGHAVGHISGLVRTTPDTFVFTGGDICHFTGDIRPSEYLPLPDTIPEMAVLDKAISRPCPCSAFISAHPKGDDGKDVGYERDRFGTKIDSIQKPFFRPSSGPNTFYADPPTSWDSCNKLIEWDADPNILIAIAHDPTSLEVFDFFPKVMNDWKEKGWKAAAHWGFLSELPYNGKCVRTKRVDGLYKNGEKIRGMQLP